MSNTIKQEPLVIKGENADEMLKSALEYAKGFNNSNTKNMEVYFKAIERTIEAAADAKADQKIQREAKKMLDKHIETSLEYENRILEQQKRISDLQGRLSKAYDNQSVSREQAMRIQDKLSDVAVVLKAIHTIEDSKVLFKMSGLNLSKIAESYDEILDIRNELQA